MTEEECNLGKYVIHMANGITVYANEEPKFYVSQESSSKVGDLYRMVSNKSALDINALALREPYSIIGVCRGEVTKFPTPRQMFIALEDIVIIEYSGSSTTNFKKVENSDTIEAALKKLSLGK